MWFSIFSTHTTLLRYLEGSKQAAVMQHHDNAYVRNTGQGEAIHRNYKRQKLEGLVGKSKGMP
jgi:hypothetical protein